MKIVLIADQVKLVKLVKLCSTACIHYFHFVYLYKTLCQLPLGQSDHNVIYLLPKYRSKLKQQAVVTILVNNCVEQLQDCFDDTDWDLFFNTGKDVNEITNTVSAYLWEESDWDKNGQNFP